VEGRLVSETSESYGIDYPLPTWAQQPAQVWLEALVTAVRRLTSADGIQPSAILALSVAAQVDGVVPIGSDGQPLSPAIIWMDRRAVAQCDRVAQTQDVEKITRITGLNLDATHVAPKIRWLAENEPEVYRQARYFLLAGSYIVYALTGEVSVDYSNASSTLLMDVTSKTWSDEMCRLFEVERDRLAPIYPATACVGRLLKPMAERMGLSESTRVVLGSGDEHAACLGAGVTQPGMVGDISGTAEPVCAASRTPAVDPSGLVETHCHADPDLWLLENPGFVSGANLRWFKEQFAPLESQAAAENGGNPYQLLDLLAERIRPGSDGLILLPCLMGAMTPTWNAAARGTFFGITLAHTRGHFVRAVLEASAYAVRDITDRLQAIGLPLSEIRAVGGGARSRLWRQIKADVTGLPVALPQTVETTSLGAGMLALVGVGAYATLAEVAQKTIKIVETIEPQRTARLAYEPYYQLYRATYTSLLPVFDQAARIERS
jgi:xylulokinase